MHKRPAIFCTLFFCLSLNCFSDSQPPAVKNSNVIKQAVFAFQAREPVRGELHRVIQPVYGIGSYVFREQADSSAFPQPVASLCLVLAKKSSPGSVLSFAVKDYLSQNYPTHSFW